MKHRADAIVALAAAAAAGVVARETRHREHSFDVTIDPRTAASGRRYTIVHGDSRWRLDDILPASWTSARRGVMSPRGEVATFTAEDGAKLRFRRLGGTTDDFLW